MSEQTALKSRIDKCITTRAALAERRKRAEADLKSCEADLKQLGLTPKNARANIEAAEEALARDVAAVEVALGIV